MTQCNVIRKENFEIKDLSYPKFVHINEPEQIEFTIKNMNRFFPDNFIVYLYNRDKIIFQDNGWVNAGISQEYTIPVTLSKPGTYHFHLSLLDDKLLSDQCEDYKNFTITCLKPGESTSTHETMNFITEYWYLFIIGLVVIILTKRML